MITSVKYWEATCKQLFYNFLTILTLYWWIAIPILWQWIKFFKGISLKKRWGIKQSFVYIRSYIEVFQKFAIYAFVTFNLQLFWTFNNCLWCWSSSYSFFLIFLKVWPDLWFGKNTTVYQMQICSLEDVTHT